MHIPENVTQTIAVEGSTLTKDDANKGICVVQTTGTAQVKQGHVPAAKSTAASQKILGTLGAGGEVANVKGLIIFQTTNQVSNAEYGQGIVTHTDDGKVDHDASGVGQILYAGNDVGGIGTWAAVLL